MDSRIDFAKYQVRTDLALEANEMLIEERTVACEKNISQIEGVIIKEKTEDDENKVIYRYTMRVNEKSYLYLYGNEGENLIYKIIVNGETVTIPWINNQNNTWYSLSSNNGIIN